MLAMSRDSSRRGRSRLLSSRPLSSRDSRSLPPPTRILLLQVQKTTSEAEKQTEEGMLTEVGMPKELQRELQTVGLEELQIQELWLYWRDDKPVYRTFTKYAVIAITTFSNRSSVAAAAVADKVWEIFQTTVDEDLKVPLSKLSLRDFGITPIRACFL